MARRTSTNKKSGAELRALREARAAVDPRQEAQHHETLFLRAVGSAQEEFSWLIEHKAWLVLGFESPADWWETRIRPAFVVLNVRPTPEMAQQIVDTIQAHERGLPAAQRRTKKQLAESALSSEWVARGRRQDRSERRDAAGADLANPTVVDGTAVEHKPVDAPDGPNPVASTPEESAETPLGGSSIHDSPAPVSPGASPIADADGREPGPTPVADERTSAADGSSQVEDSPETGDGDVLGVAVSGQSHPLLVAGEAPTDEVEPSVSGAGPSDEGEASGDETAEGLQAPGPSAVDPEEPFTEWGDDLIDVIGRRPAALEALGAPALYLEALWREVDELTQWCDEVDRIRKGAAS